MRPRLSAIFWSLGLVFQYSSTLIRLKWNNLLILIFPRRARSMSYQAVKEYLIVIVKRYQRGSKIEKSRLLTEATQVTQLSRKHLIRILGRPELDLIKRKKSGRKPLYSAESLVPHIEFLWIQMERITARRMKAALPEWLAFYESKDFSIQIRLALEKMSISTLERFLRLIRKGLRANQGLSTTCPARFMKNKIPLNTFDAKIDRPGFVQADTVAHCGTTTAGTYINSITLTDIDSTWTENRALFSKKAIEVRKQFVDLEKTLPFKLLAINTDSGSEFLNTPMLQYMRRPYGKDIVFTRSRPYKKNDNCYVEQKNYTHVRELFGYERMEEFGLVTMMNEIYKTAWNPLQNYFIPTFKLKEKIRVGSKIVKKFDRPETPYARLMKSTHLTEEQKDKLKQLKITLNPFQLKKDLESKLKLFFEQLKKFRIREAA